MKTVKKTLADKQLGGLSENCAGRIIGTDNPMEASFGLLERNQFIRKLGFVTLYHQDMSLILKLGCANG